MKTGTEILIGAAALLIAVTGCSSRQQGGTANAANAAGGAHSVAASWSVGGTSWSSGQTMELKDPGLGETAYTVTVPAGWKSVGMILRPAGCYRPSVPADGLSYTILAPDGYTAVGQLPGSSWSWSSDGTSPQGPKCAPIAIDTAASFLLNIAVPNMHPDATSVTVVPPTPQMQQNLAAMQRQVSGGPAFGMQIRRRLDTARVRLDYNLGDQPMEEMLFAMLDCTENAFPARAQGTA